MIFDSVENINSAAHVLEMIDMTIDDIEKIKMLQNWMRMEKFDD